jgi:hypothetical protein
MTPVMLSCPVSVLSIALRTRELFRTASATGAGCCSCLAITATVSFDKADSIVSLGDRGFTRV